MRILIAGAGLGGLTTALSLLRRGFDVEVYEQASELSEVGAGVQISPNGTRVLFALGLERELVPVSWAPNGKQLRIWNTGKVWPQFDLGTEAVRRYGYPYLNFHRADLHAILAAAVRQARPDAIHLNAKCVDSDQDGDAATLRLEDGTAVRGDILVGADGVHSVVRQSLFGPDSPEFTGCIAWRGIIATARLPEHLRRPVGTNWVGPGGHIVHYFLRRGELLNFVGIRERRDWQVESWIVRGSMTECAADYEGWHEDVHTLIANIDIPYKWALKARAPMDRWSSGRITLLGDACHATLPFMAQGAVMAIEDGYVLARALASYSAAPEEALRRYEHARRERTARVVTGSSRMTEIFHNPLLSDECAADEYMTTNWNPEAVREKYEWLFSYDALNEPI